jgi:hypothetical protein
MKSREFDREALSVFPEWTFKRPHTVDMLSTHDEFVRICNIAHGFIDNPLSAQYSRATSRHTSKRYGPKWTASLISLFIVFFCILLLLLLN